MGLCSIHAAYISVLLSMNGKQSANGPHTVQQLTSMWKVILQVFSVDIHFTHFSRWARAGSTCTPPPEIKLPWYSLVAMGL